MAYHIQSSFSAGELDPALHERTTFEKYQAGLATLRNAVIGKTGRIISRGGTKFSIETKNATAQGGSFTAAVGGVCTKTSHGLGTGTAVMVSTTGSLPGGLSANTTYYVVGPSGLNQLESVHENVFGLALTEADAYAGTEISISSTGAGDHTITPIDVGSKKSVLYSPPFSEFVIEWGHRYVRIHDTSDGTYTTHGHGLTEEDLDYLQFFSSGKFLYVLRNGEQLHKIVLGDLDANDPTIDARFVYDGYGLFSYPRQSSGTAPTFVSATPTGAPAGYSVEYVFTYVLGGEESIHTAASGALNLPVAAGQFNTIIADTSFNTISAIPTELRVYRRPATGQAYGYIGTVGSPSVSGGRYRFTFVDYGGDADYAHSPPTLDSALPSTNSYTFLPFPKNLLPRAGCVYQQRLVLSNSVNEEAIHTSRTGFHDNFTRDYPLAADSALSFKAGSSGNAKVLRLLDNNGLIAFTTAGIFISTGALSPTNISMDKKGNWVIEEKVPPLEVPGGVLFVDKSTNTVRSLIYSNEAGGYPGEEVSIFSNHLFVNKTIKSWAFQDGDIPLVWVVFDDGSLAALTYQREHQMQAWSRHDTEGLYESVTVIKDVEEKSVVYFIIKRGDKRFIEYTTPRFTDDFKELVLMDSAVSFNSQVTPTATIDVQAVDVNDWEGLLELTSNIPAFVNTAGNGAVGTVFKFFDSDKSGIELEVTAFLSTTQIRVQPAQEFPAEQNTDITLYKTYTELTGLEHLNGKFVYVMVDGYVIASPNNNIENYGELMVENGELTLPGDTRGAFVHVGLPYTCDVEPLDVDTVEQKPTLLESRLVNKLYMKVYNTRGLYIGSEFPVNDYVQGMTDPEVISEDIEFGVVGNAAQEPVTKRLEIPIPNDWNKGGRVCIRQVDPLPFEILSIIPDMTILR